MNQSTTKTCAEYIESAASFEENEEFDLALNLYREALKLWPGEANLYYRLGRMLCKTNGFLNRKAALGLFNRAIALNPDCLDAYLALGAELGNVQDTLHEGIEVNRRAQSLFGQTDDLLIQHAHLLDRTGNKRGAADIVREVVSKNKQNPGRAALLYAEIADTSKDQQDALAYLESRLNTPLSKDDKTAAYFSLGRLQDRMGLYEDAFQNIAYANNLLDIHYDNSIYQQRAERIADFFSKQRLRTLPQATQPSEAPIFIIGLPRSGSTLIEQILSAHPGVYAGGETDYISLARNYLASFITEEIIFPDFLACLSEPQLTQASSDQLDRMLPRGTPCQRVTDKSLSNYLRIGLLSMLFPRARIIHTQRYPLDNCLSCYFSYFPGTPYIYRQEDLADNYRNYQFLMEHWRTVATIPILDVRYEDVVLKPRETIARVLDFCGLSWHDACLKFYKSKRLTATASYRQVRKPLYTESIGRWRNYESHLGPLISSLGESCREYETPSR